jgi:hypothetical protein
MLIFKTPYYPLPVDAAPPGTVVGEGVGVGDGDGDAVWANVAPAIPRNIIPKAAAATTFCLFIHFTPLHKEKIKFLIYYITKYFSFFRIEEVKLWVRTVKDSLKLLLNENFGRN